MSSFGSQNQLQNSLAHLGKLLKVVLFLTNFNRFNPPYPPKQKSQKKNASSPSKSPVWKEKYFFKWFIHLSCISCVFLLFWVSLVLLLLDMFICLFIAFNKIKKIKNKKKKEKILKNTKIMCVSVYRFVCGCGWTKNQGFLTLYLL